MNMNMISVSSTLQCIRMKRSGFTIVELLIVVVVIAILATITIVAYNGVANNAKVSAIKSDLSSIARKVETYKIGSSVQGYPTSLASAGITPPSSGTAHTYLSSTAQEQTQGFCLEIQHTPRVKYYVSNSGVVSEGSCADVFGIVGAWRFNNSLADSSPLSWPVVSSGTFSPINGQNGQANGAYQLAANSQLSVPTFSSPGTAGFSISGWVYPQNNPSSHQGYFGIRTGNKHFYVLQLFNSNSLECRVGPNGWGAGSFDAGTVTVNPNAWNHVVFAYDGASARCYVNAQGGTSTSGTGLMNPQNDPLNIGSDGSNRFLGRIDDVRVYSRGLSQADVQYLYDKGAQ